MGESETGSNARQPLAQPAVRETSPRTTPPRVGILRGHRLTTLNAHIRIYARTKPMKTPSSLLVVTLFAGALAASALAQGLPPEAHDNIHTLFDQHAAVKRTV